MTSFIGRHSLAFALAIVVGVLMVAPQIVFMKRLGSEYRGIYIMKTDAEVHYLATMRDAVVGNSVGNPFVSLEENEGVPSAAYSYVELLLTAPARIFPVSIPTLNLVYKALLPALLVLVAYAFTLRLTENRIWSQVAGVLVVAGGGLLSVPDILNFIRGDMSYIQFALFSRPVNPQFSTLFFFGYLHILLSAFRSGKGIWFAALGAVFGASFFVYFYTFTFLFVLNGLTLLYTLAVRRDGRMAFYFASATAAGLIIGSPALHNSYLLTNHANYPTLEAISGIIRSRAPVVSTVWIAVSILFAFGAYRRRYDENGRFVGIFLTATLVVVNQQVITGTLIQEGHYHWYINIPLFCVAIAYVLSRESPDLRSGLSKSLAAALIIFALAQTAFVQASSYQAHYSGIAAIQKYGPVLDWLGAHGASDQSVLANNEFSLLLPIYTSLNPSWNFFNLAYLYPTGHSARALFTYLRLYNLGPSVLNEERFFHPPVADGKERPEYEHIETAVLLGNYMQGIYPDGMARNYAAFWDQPFAEVFAELPADYVVWDKGSEPMWEFGQDRLPVLFEYGDMLVYATR